MNEPHRGYLNLPSLHKFDYNTDLHLGTVRAYISTWYSNTLSHVDLRVWAQHPPSNHSSLVQAIQLP